MASMSATVRTRRTGNVARRRPSVPLPPSEWDFRGIDPNHLPAILFYERAREDKHLKRGLSLTKKHRRTIHGWIADEFSNESIVSQLAGAKPEDDYLCLNVIAGCWLSKKFPASWMSLSDAEREEVSRRFTANEHLSGKLGFRIISRAELARVEAVEDSFKGIFPVTPKGKGSRTRITIEVDWARLDNPNLKWLFAGLVNLRPQGIWPRKRLTGNAAAIPFHKLKQLAAWRLSTKARFSYTKAQQVISDRREGFPMNFTNKSEPNVYPEYISSGAWFDAVAAGKKIVIRGC